MNSKLVSSMTKAAVFLLFCEFNYFFFFSCQAPAKLFFHVHKSLVVIAKFKNIISNFSATHMLFFENSSVNLLLLSCELAPLPDTSLLVFLLSVC